LIEPFQNLGSAESGHINLRGFLSGFFTTQTFDKFEGIPNPERFNPDNTRLLLPSDIGII
jgi:hypothetical protein